MLLELWQKGRFPVAKTHAYAAALFLQPAMLRFQSCLISTGHLRKTSQSVPGQSPIDDTETVIYGDILVYFKVLIGFFNF